MNLYKIFSKKCEAKEFLLGKVTFTALVNYKVMTSIKGVSDKLDGEISLNLPASKYTLTINNHTILPSDMTSFKFSTGSDTSNNYLIFCASTIESNNSFQKGLYKYYVKFDSEELRTKLEVFFSKRCNYYKINSCSNKDYFPINDNLMFFLPPNLKLKHGLISYYDENVFPTKINPLFSKRSEYSNQLEYRYAFSVDYYQYEKVGNKVKAKKKIINIDNIKEHRLKICFELDKIHPLEFKKITA